MYQALYRKWRPRVFADVVGQEHVTRTLRKQVAEGRTSHAYLFTGTRGTGKTTCAKILARAVNCEHPDNGDPCGVCPSCVGLENESFLDVLELDAASNNGVDQVRALRDEAAYSPANVKKRVYIIDEVHMLSVPAFNALLKILEEPPEHLMFILATTELHKVPATILSRCQRYAFRRIRPQDIQGRLAWVAEQEHIALTEDGAELLSRLADGALRDGLSLLDQCAAAGGKVDAAAVLEILGLAGRLETAALLENVLKRETSAALLALGRAYDNGKDVGAVLGELSDLVRDLLILRTAPEGGTALLSGGYDAAALERLGRMAGTARLLYLASALRTASADMYNSANRRTDAELCMLRLCDETLTGDVEALSARVERLEAELARVRRGEVPAVTSQGGFSVPPPNNPPWDGGQPPPDNIPWDEEPPPDNAPWDAGEPPPDNIMPWDGGQSPPDNAPWDEEPLPNNLPWDAGQAPPDNAPLEVLQPPPQNDTPPDNPPPEPAPAPRPANPNRRAIPREDTTPTGGGRTDAIWWQGVVTRCCQKIPAMYRSFLKRCEGVREGDLLIICAPDSTTLTRFNNDRVKGVLLEESGASRLSLREGTLPPPSTGPGTAGPGIIPEPGTVPEPGTAEPTAPEPGTAELDTTPEPRTVPEPDSPPEGGDSPDPPPVPQSTQENLRELLAFSRQHGIIQITGGTGTPRQT